MDELPITLKVENLTKRYGTASKSVETLKDVSFQVRLGQICCLLGPNGSGKTTLLKTLAGLLQPTSGSISINGIDPNQDPLGARAKIGWMPSEEKSGFYGRLTGRQNLMFFGVLQGLLPVDMERLIGNLALQIGFGEELDKSMLQISSGAKQKISLARALLHNPPVLLLDEPIRNLDPHTVLRFRQLLKNHLARNQNRTILLSTHLLDEARRLADIILILFEGRVLKAIEAKDLDHELKSRTLEEYYLKVVDGAKAL